jgi:nitroimidazol reductase NimA-like FMN-containing flavoprotein (pyridoxamine 5'-phosphate oxidase superfamily)
MSGREINQLIEEQFLCRIAFCGKKNPYIALFQYALINGQLYFHFTKYGKKIGLLGEGRSVCVEIEKYTQDLNEYGFITLTGELRIVKDREERALAIEKLVEAATKKGLSENFLSAHGFSREKGWAYLTADKPIIIVKLINVTDRIGLKSP